jgi:release factor glutamine methyltransferase
MTSEVWTIQKTIQWTSQHFLSKKIESARLDTELLLAKALGCKRIDLYLKFDQPLKANELKTFKEMVVRRSQREPVAYILGVREFFGREFEVGPGVLIPRPETELLIDLTLAHHTRPLKILDVGCGSGAIAVTLAAEIEQSQVHGLDASEKACGMTAANSTKHGVESRLKITHGEFLKHEQGEPYELVVSNPPYIGLSIKDSLQPEVGGFEPELALFGGEKGHEILEQWIPKMGQHLLPGGLLLCEIGYDQEEISKNITERTHLFDSIQIHKDLNGNPRVLKAQRKKA